MLHSRRDLHSFSDEKAKRRSTQHKERSRRRSKVMGANIVLSMVEIMGGRVLLRPQVLAELPKYQLNRLGGSLSLLATTVSQPSK